MILSYHPIIEADRNIICAGREPNDADLAAIAKAEAVILPQGCSEMLYRMAKKNCAHVFPNLDVRFDFPGKRGQIELFRSLGVAHPRSVGYASVAVCDPTQVPLDFPVVVKFDWGGQGDTVFKATCHRELAAVLDRAAAFEASGQYGFLIQEYVSCGQSALRVAVIGSRRVSYWRRQPKPARFGTSVADGARIDHDSEPELQAAARDVVALFCDRCGLQLAGFDFIFRRDDPPARPPLPLALEINYYFGRTGIGGSDAYYAIVEQEVDKWLAHLELQRKIIGSKSLHF